MDSLLKGLRLYLKEVNDNSQKKVQFKNKTTKKDSAIKKKKIRKRNLAICKQRG